MGHLPEHLQARPSKVEQRAARERNLKRAIREKNEEVDRLREALKHHEAEIAELREDKEIESAKLQHLIAAFDDYKQKYRKGQPSVHLEIAALRKENQRLMCILARSVLLQKRAASVACPAEDAHRDSIEDREVAELCRVCINCLKGTIDMRPVPDSNLCSRSAPEVHMAPAMKPTYMIPLELPQVVGEDPSVGSRGHSDGECAGYCPQFKESKRCKFGIACKRCHVHGCARVEGQRARRRRQASQELAKGQAVGAPSAGASSSAGNEQQGSAESRNDAMAAS